MKVSAVVTLLASLMAPRMMPPAKPPKTAEYTPNMAKQMERISGGAVAARVWKMAMAMGAIAALASSWNATTSHSLGM